MDREKMLNKFKDGLREKITWVCSKECYPWKGGNQLNTRLNAGRALGIYTGNNLTDQEINYLQALREAEFYDEMREFIFEKLPNLTAFLEERLAPSEDTSPAADTF